MKKPGMKTLSNRMVEKLVVEKDSVYWDRDLSGFGVRVYPSGSKVYVAQARGPKGSKRVTIGRHGVLNADEARRRAALAISRVKAGEEAVPKPLRPKAGPTVAEVAARYLTEYVEVRYKPSTAATTRTVLQLHILPALGKTPLAAVERAEVAELHQRLHETPSIANSAVGTLSTMYLQAERWGIVPEGMNPCRAVARYPKRKGERFLTDEEFIRLGRALDEMETRGRRSESAVAALRLLALTGCRKSEILTLRWENVALEESELRLADSKTGARIVPLPPPAVALLAALPREEGNPWVIRGTKPGARLGSLDHGWYSVRAQAGLNDVRLHDLRHSFASRALALGESLPMIGKLLGHSRIETTARYAHLARDTAHEAAERVAASIADDILGKGWKQTHISQGAP